MKEHPSKIYLLPNLMTAGNLFCGFTACLKMLEGALLQASNPDAAGDLFHTAIWCVLGAFIFDFLDGRIARLGGNESAFGREFDSLADIVSFGLAPALMVYRVVLQEFPRACWLIAFVYLACGALRLARFNTAAANHEREGSSNTTKNFTGFPIPAAAGLIASITLFLLWLAEGEHRLGNWRFLLPPLLLFLSFMMFSQFEYPSFKAINWRTKKSIPRFLAIILILIFTVLNYEWMPAVLFLAYLLYGFLRPWLSREWRREIEEEIGEEGEEPTEQIS
ncbi:MAG TPA: CDP-diacylglycerol--serine O-phosphatidyltransferase [Chthoniobacterales bacterium]|jgi:CDP-diacylglycerol--serine O-phosphatidyltransferase